MFEELNSRQALIIPYRVPQSGAVLAKVTSREPVNTYVLDEEGKLAYEAGKLKPLASHKDDIIHELTVGRQRPGTMIYLIVENPSEQASVQLEYQVGEPILRSAMRATGSLFR